jgi:hypothetical protein
MNRTIVGLVSLTVFMQASCATDGASSRGGPNASCYRHINNTSTASWTFQFAPASGNTYFIGVQGCPQNGPCTIAAGTSPEIQYTMSEGIAAGSVTITDQTGAAQSFGYLNEYSWRCPSINHSGSTGSVNLNDPGNGDFWPWAATWNDGAGKRAPASHRRARPR